jgi:hypothetical protein
MITAMPDIDPAYPIDLTPEEEAAGFELTTVKNPQGQYGMPFGLSQPDPEIQAVVKQLPGGLRAVKVKTPVSGDIAYAIWNDKNRGVRDSVFSVKMLLQMYPS